MISRPLRQESSKSETSLSSINVTGKGQIRWNEISEWFSKWAERERMAWEPLIFKTEAILGKGIFELVYGIYRHKQALEQNQALEKKLRERTKTTFLEILESEVMAHFIEKMEKEGQWDKIIDDLMNRRTDPYSVAEKVMAEELKTSLKIANCKMKNL